ncbi:MAG: flagellar hook-associated protein FlgK [Bacteroidota bacterium]
MSIQQLISISRSSFRSLDAAMNATAQNVANMETEGYTRRRVTLQSDSLHVTGMYSPPAGRTATGAGVSVQEYERLRDVLLQKSGWEARSGLGGFEEQHRVLGTIEGLLSGNGTSSLSRQLDAFYDSWALLADQPNDSAVRLQLRSEAQGIASTLNRLDGDLAHLSGEIHTDLAATVGEANDLLKDIASLTETISLARNQGAPDLSAEDRRDQLIDTLSGLLPINVQADRREGFTITTDGMTLVQGAKAVELSTVDDGGVTKVGIGGEHYTLQQPTAAGGRIGAQLETINVIIPEARAELDVIAERLVEKTNEAHRSGYGIDGSTGIDFFDATRTTAGSIRLSADVSAAGGHRLIAASTSDPGAGFYDSDVARTIASHGKGFDGGAPSASASFIDLTSSIGSRMKHASAEGTARAGVVDHLTALERGVSGVNLEEEMTSLIQFQQAYAASARVLNTAQEMMDTLLRL